MQYFSTNRKSAHVTFREAVLKGQPEDKGLYFPEQVPKLRDEFLANLYEKPRVEIAFEVIKPFIDSEIPEEILYQICEETVDFDFPLVKINRDISTLELFHGPTLAFKDVGARFMSRCLGYFSKEKSEKTIILVATSGDTGGAVANGFFGVENTEVVILYPKGKVSRVQELQLATLGGNITAIEVDGSFDDCQALTKTALADQNLKEQVFITSANSINVARWLPQQFYYFYAGAQWIEETDPVISVPSGNFGNICAGLMAHVSGLPVGHFIAATNANDKIPKYIATGKMESQPPVQTLSNAMDVAEPSNFVRIMEIFQQNFPALKRKMSAVSVTDEQTRETMRDVYKTYDYVLDPHGAVGFIALDRYLTDNPGTKGFFLETAHPVKFDSVKEIVGTFGHIPPSVNKLLGREKQTIEMDVDYEALKEVLIEKG